ncbi:DUF262 domain-containing protein [Methylomonas sp. BW4-1]|uniref:DUF262 domain-containing protein n=1 Tax=Methylomonas sp. BW4-1 TaxID=3376685 RepID=UPI00404127E3
MTDESKLNTVVVDGEAAILMRALRNHTSLNYEELKSLVEHKLESDEYFDLVLDYVKEKIWIENLNNRLSLTEQGASWLDIQGNELDVEAEDTSSADKPKHPYDVAKLKMETKYLSIFQALRKIEKNEIILNPDFQRAFVWDVTKQSRLVESILIRIPLPAFYIDATDQVSWNVVDGLQRLTTMYKYCRKQDFALIGLQFLTELEGLKFEELPPQYRILIEDDTPLLFYNLMPGTPVQAKYTIFSRVNTGGMQLTPQEIRHALSQGKSTKLLQRLAVGNDFRSATDGVVESVRMSDRELILRSLAFMSLGVDAYKNFNELDKFLLHAMDKFNGLSDSELKKIERDFVESLKKVRAVFGRYAFRKFTQRNGRRSPLNKALFEVWTVSVRNYTQDQLILNKDRIIDGFIELISSWDNSFSRSISSGTSSSWAVITRFGAIDKLLKESCQ